MDGSSGERAPGEPGELRATSPRHGWLPASRPTHHLPNFLWWLGLVGLAAATLLSGKLDMHGRPDPLALHPREREAFVVLSFGKIAESGQDVIHKASFAEGLEALREAGYSSVSLADVDRFLRDRKPLPERPLLLVFEEVQRASTEIADATLRAVGFRGVAFADVPELEAGSVDLVSRHRLAQLVAGGRWEIGIAGCGGAPERESAETSVSVQELRRARALVESWTGRSPLAIDCHIPLSAGDAARDIWRRALESASFRLAFVLGNPRAVYRDDPPFELRRVRVGKDWGPRELLAHVAASEPRRGPFVDDFSAAEPSPAWFIDRGDVAEGNRTFELAAKQGESGSLVLLRGTERWRDAYVGVEVAEVIRGQFWIALRARPGPSLRFGLVDGDAVLQTSDGTETHQIARRTVGRREVKLGLRVIGDRAIATLDGEPFLDRPAELPAGLEYGPLALAVWDPDGGAKAWLRRVVARPLQPECGIVSASPAAEAWEELRGEINDLTALSPRYFAWRGDRAVAAEAQDPAMAIFASYHRVKLLPAVRIELGSATDLAALEDQLVRWVGSADFDGLNLVVEPKLVTDRNWLRMLGDLDRLLRKRRKELALTLVGGDPEGVDVGDVARVFYAREDDVSALQTAVGPLTLVGP
ncbi:MAG TPA: hypothetical protein VLF14_05075 [Candidatus Binatia bacterium]|nr:hypothetical protein [Candidatus Binatia bacterium]